MKKGKFSFTDRAAEMRGVGYQDSYRKRPASFREDSETVTLKIKRNRQSDNLEVLLKLYMMKFVVSLKSVTKRRLHHIHTTRISQKNHYFQYIYTKVKNT